KVAPLKIKLGGF
nr:Chain A, CHD4 [Homo sapiens]